MAKTSKPKTKIVNEELNKEVNIESTNSNETNTVENTITELNDNSDISTNVNTNEINTSLLKDDSPDYLSLDEIDNSIKENVETDILNDVKSTLKAKVKIKPLSPLFKPLEKANNDNANACYDVIATSINITDKYIEYGLGFSCEFDENYMMVITPRSSISKYNLVMANSQGIIDSSYRDELKVRFKIVPNTIPHFMYKETANVSSNKIDKTYSFNEVESTKELKNAYDKDMLKSVHSLNLQNEETLIFGYKSPIKYSDLNLYKVGDKIAQIYMQELVNTSFEYIDNNQELSKSKRNGGFGSTGK